MKIFTNKTIWKKIAIVLIFIILFQAIATNPAVAKSDGDVLEGGGKLLKPIFSLLVTVGDGIMNILHSSIMGIDESLIKVDTKAEWWKTLITVISVIITVACIIGAIILSGGVATILAWTAVIQIAGSLVLGTNFIANLAEGAGQAVMSQFGKDSLPSKLYLPLYSYSPEEIFRGNILLFNVNFFREPYTIKEATKKNEDGDKVISYYYYEDENGKDLDTDGDGNNDTKGYITSNQDSAAILQKTISSWYNAIKNICLVLMLSILVYIGIRILLSSVASDKAKYQTMLKDWLIGLCLLFLMHYIMAFSVTIVDKLTDVVSTSLDDNKYIALIPYKKEIKKDLEEIGLEEKLRVNAEEPKDGYAWPSNLMGYLRMKSQLNSHGWQYVGEAIIFLTLIMFTIMFTFTYFRRLLHMAFLTIIAPLVALTYCIDKLNDGQAQGFNKWFKEYIFNLLIQPMHLLLYYILITSTFELMGENIIYAMVATGFMIPAEKLLRSLFGFEKAATAPAIGPAGAMMASSLVSGLLNKRSGGAGKGEKASSKDDDSSDKVPKPRESNPVDAFLDEAEEDDDSPQQQMLDNYDEQFGGEDWDPAEREAMAREANGNEGSMNYSNEEYEDIVRGTLGPDASEEEVQRAMQEWYGNEGQTSENNRTNRTETESTGRAPTTPTTETPTQNSKKPRKIRRAIARRAHAYKAVGKAVIRDIPRKAKGLPKKAIRTVGKVGAGVAVGALAAGATAGITMATGDGSNVAKATAAAATAGFAMGTGMGKGTTMKPELKEAYDQAYDKSKEYKQDAMNDYVKDYMKDPKNKTYFEESLGKEEARKMYKSGEIEEYLNNGINNKKEIKALHKLQKETGIDRKRAIAVSQLNKMVGEDTNNMGQEKRDDWEQRLGGMAAKSGIRDRQGFAKKRLEEMDKLNDLMNK